MEGRPIFPGRILLFERAGPFLGSEDVRRGRGLEDSALFAEDFAPSEVFLQVGLFDKVEARGGGREGLFIGKEERLRRGGLVAGKVLHEAVF